jgi:plastocyanin
VTPICVYEGMTRVTLGLVVALALVAAGCGGSNNSSSSSSSGSSSSTTTRSAPATSTASSKSSAGGVTIKMQDIKFVPGSETVKVGQKVTWTNSDSVAHNVTAKKGASFRSQTFGHGGTFTFTPTKAGTISYVCTIHPGMDGTLNVTK